MIDFHVSQQIQQVIVDEGQECTWMVELWVVGKVDSKVDKKDALLVVE